ncbi:MAG: Metallopeptidase [Candidatus Levybacteria bacterium GW2011_GWA2_36_13]|uniref:Metallopeptidase n=1 Tax=Candidatus Giovannonibacteria bacterium GW2011_GWA1_44_25 TaxID=1618645 RepID=A0A0G1KRL2_9BACT|nr:MAG: Metallopeptidase [Candidatus Levybacteria bacterium GW2011_GWA2_36_13]KKP99934.1 MAG: Metallopeptidase [Candidatus Levybacteria bacterium GW2011_GWB1_36_18]KKT58992.1 MAG: Metallopeptidase [Candidatus Giovannonibacteria bacterium GW2011_GWA1_44_25]OGH44450.1 MAG: hypothetical protein A3I49_02205 [Candidatus Levybacteria bacterium RIFCSPLOWO2_02_FULL_37_11]OGH52626.1 MAG: hypothetical protein A2423_00305 [Candidatus Levybacteria bacterium RIFOXYC1_FULL_40_10]
MEWKEAKDVKKDLLEITSRLNFSHVNINRIFCYRSFGSKSRAHARIWAIPKIFQDALNIEPAYVIEVLSEHYDKYDEDFKKRVLIHELLHIPKNFSGALLSHKRKGRHLDRLANELFIKYKTY